MFSLLIWLIRLNNPSVNLLIIFFFLFEFILIHWFNCPIHLFVRKFINLSSTLFISFVDFIWFISNWKEKIKSKRRKVFIHEMIFYIVKEENKNFFFSVQNWFTSNLTERWIKTINFFFVLAFIVKLFPLFFPLQQYEYNLWQILFSFSLFIHSSYAIETFYL